MAGIRQEDALMKVPAMLHLSRLGYTSVSREALSGRCRETNILPGELREAMERINGQRVPEEAFQRLMREIRISLETRDLGQRFYRIIRDGWQGWRLLDYDRPEGNRFQMASELSCGTGKTRFRPDITLFVNGLPLGMIEVKTSGQKFGIREEYDRMVERFGTDEFRRYLQAAQIWAFSNDRDADPDHLLPVEGSFYATGARRDFPIYAFGEACSRRAEKLPKLNREAEAEILAANGMAGWKRDLAFRRSLSAGTPAHRLLTELFGQERFLFLLRYGVTYAREMNPLGEMEIQKRLPGPGEMAALRSMREKARRGFRNWRTAAAGAAGEMRLLAMTVCWLRDRYPGSRVTWLASGRRELRETEERLREFGLVCGRRGKREKNADLTIAELSGDPREWLREPDERDFSGQRIFLIPEDCRPGTEKGKSFDSMLRAADPGMILIRWKRAAVPRGGNYVYMLKCADGTLYCGWTSDLRRRLRTHNAGQGAKYTRSRRPVELVYTEEYDSPEQAMSREWHLKRLTRAQKERLISGRFREETET